MKPIERAIEESGLSQKALAEAIGVFPQALHQWVSGKRPVPAKHCIAIEIATGGAVTRHDLRPDVFGAAPADDQPAAA